MKPVFSIRPASPADRSTIRRLMNLLQESERVMESNRAQWPDGGIAYTDWTLDEVTANQGAIFVAESETGAAIGFLSCWRMEDPTDITVIPEARPALYVADLVVLEEWRGLGVAGVLLAEAEKHGRAMGLRQMTIGVLAVNTAARRAYAKAGFDEYEMLLRKAL